MDGLVRSDRTVDEWQKEKEKERVIDSLNIEIFKKVLLDEPIPYTTTQSNRTYLLVESFIPTAHTSKALVKPSFI